jgi:PAS domain S-box-containing protein
VERIVGRSAAELRAMPVMTILPPEERARLGQIRAELQASGKPAPPLLETIVVRPDGTRVPIELGIATRRDGEYTIAFVFMRDLSVRRQLQARLLEADRLATVGALCAGLAHEINNPLTSVLLHLSGLRRSLDRLVPDAASRGYVTGVLDVVLEGAERVSRSVKELMVFADPSVCRRGPVDVRTVVERALRAATPMVEVRARLEVGLDEVPEIDGDPPRLGQAVLNLLIDAAQAFDRADRERNVVAVTLRSEPAWVVLEVADNGRTFEAHDGAAFEPFFPVRGAASTGIGLAVTRTIVASLGGAVSVVPRDGGGAVATIRLPQR